MAVFDIGEHMVIDPEIMHGQMTFKGTRVPVSTVMAFLEQGLSVDELVKEWPQLSTEAVREAIRLAAESFHHRYQVELLAAQDEARRLRDAATDEKPAEVAGS